MTDAELNAMSPLALAHVGDAVFDLLVRTRLCLDGRLTAGDLHRETVRYVSAVAQAAAAEIWRRFARRGKRAFIAGGATPTAMPHQKAPLPWNTTPPPGWRRCSDGCISGEKKPG